MNLIRNTPLPAVPEGIRRVRVLVAGATGVVGESVLMQLAAQPRVAQVGLLVQRMAPLAIRRVLGVEADPAGPQAWLRPPASEGVILFERPRRLRRQDKNALRIKPQQLIEIARWMRDCGVLRLLVVLPQDPWRLPGATRRGLEQLNPQDLGALGFESVLIVHGARAAVTGTQRAFWRRAADPVLGALGRLLPPRQQPLMVERIACLATALLEQAPRGLHEIKPELVWEAGHGEPETVLTRWLHGLAPVPDHAA